MPDADAGSRDYRTDGAPTGASRLRMPKMRVCDERLGVKRDGPLGGSAPAGTRRCCPLTHPYFPSAQRSSAPEHNNFGSAWGHSGHKWRYRLRGLGRV